MIRLIVQTPVYRKDGPATGPGTPPVAYRYRVVKLDEVEAAKMGYVPSVELAPEEHVIWVLQ